MLTIKVLGSGCANCKRLAQITSQIVAELDIDAEIIKGTEPAVYADYGVLATPGLVINEVTVCSGRIPSKSEITEFITSAVPAV